MQVSAGVHGLSRRRSVLRQDKQSDVVEMPTTVPVCAKQVARIILVAKVSGASPLDVNRRHRSARKAPTSRDQLTSRAAISDGSAAFHVSGYAFDGGRKVKSRII